jgi:LysR family transcriptional regulator, transcriptional activator for dmlA
MKFADLQLILTISQTGSMSAAAQKLQLSKPQVSKQLATIEAQLGCKLFQRSTRRLSMTSAGELVCQRAPQLLQQWSALEADLSSQQNTLRGLIKLASTFGFGRHWLGPALTDFQTQYPGIEFDLRLCEQLPNLETERFDGAVWLWAPVARRSLGWTMRRLARNQRILVASPDYLSQHGAPKQLKDLAHHACLLVREHDYQGDSWPLQKITVQRRSSDSHEMVKVHGALSSNSGELVRDWCLQHKGIMLRSVWDVAAYLKAGRLKQVLPAYAMLDADIHWLAPKQLQTPKKTRLLIDFLVERFKNEPWMHRKI